MMRESKECEVRGQNGESWSESGENCEMNGEMRGKNCMMTGEVKEGVREME